MLFEYLHIVFGDTKRVPVTEGAQVWSFDSLGRSGFTVPNCKNFSCKSTDHVWIDVSQKSWEEAEMWSKISAVVWSLMGPRTT